MKEDSMDDVKLTSINHFKEEQKQKAADMPKIEDKNHPVYWSETKWQTEYFNENPNALWALEGYKNMVIRKYEEEQKLIDGWEVM